MKQRVYLVAYFKFDDRGAEYGFKRLHLQTVHIDWLEATTAATTYFCDEGGWYEGSLIEEREVDTNMFHGRRVFYRWNSDTNQMEEMPSPEFFKDVVNLI